MLKVEHIVVAAAVVLIGLTGVKYCHDLGEWKAQSEAFAEKNELLSDSVEHYRNEAEKADSAADAKGKELNARISEHEGEIRSINAEAEEAERRIDEALEEADEEVAVAVRTAVDSLKALHEAEIFRKNSIIFAKDSIIELKDAQIETRNEHIASLQIRLNESEEQREFWRIKAKPSILGLEIPSGVVLGGVALTGFVLGRL